MTSFRYAEPVLNIKKGKFHDFDLILFDKVIAYDHLKQKISIIVNMRTDKVMENYGKATARIQSIANMIQSKEIPDIPVSESRIEFTCNVSKEEYCRLVERTKKYIVDGDIFQAVISRQFTSPYEGSLINPYRFLRTTNPSPYMVYMHIDGEEIMSTSPETLVRLQNGRVTTFPVAGSRPRGKTVEADIKDECDGLSAIESVLPAGTLSGAPKIRACEIIEEMESEERGVYGGALGYLDFTGNMDTCIAIRMAVKKDGKVYVQAGGGIVADSVPQREYEESANKAAAVMNAIKCAGEVLES